MKTGTLKISAKKFVETSGHFLLSPDVRKKATELDVSRGLLKHMHDETDPEMLSVLLEKLEKFVSPNVEGGAVSVAKEYLSQAGYPEVVAAIEDLVANKNTELPRQLPEGEEPQAGGNIRTAEQGLGGRE